MRIAPDPPDPLEITGEMLSFASPAFTESRYFTLRPLAAGVWAALAVPGSGAGGNAGIVDLGGHTLVFDTFATPAAGTDLHAIAEGLTGQPATWVVNSHHHIDHVLGNQAFPQAQIVATARTHELIVTRGAALIEQANAHPEILDSLRAALAAEPDANRRQELVTNLAEYSALDAALPTLQLHPPNMTFAGRLVFHGSRRRAELLTYGGGHSESDAFLYLPQERIGFLGDLVQVDVHPPLAQGDPAGWDRVLEQIGALELETVVPGHGPLGDGWAIMRMRQYITDLQNLVLAVRAADGDVAAVAALPLPAPYAAWAAPSVFTANLRFLFDRLAAAPGP
ncbi:MAG: MBL fold metallo-hydrolase [Chloroflexota bacterium]|nr:MBL fold metallo-hydrolase [Chloroflexota bacterium]